VCVLVCFSLCVIIVFFSDCRIYLFSSLAARVFNKLTRYSLKSQTASRSVSRFCTAHGIDSQCQKSMIHA